MTNFYISRQGNDANPGTSEKPFATVEHARDVLRELIAQGLTEPVTVHVAAGEYNIDSITFDARDSGTENCPVIYEADGEAVFNGGLTLPAELFGTLDADEKSRLHGNARERVVRADLKRCGLTREVWGELCVIGSYHTGARYDGAVLSPMWCELFVNDRRQTIARYPDDGYLYTGEPVREGKGLETGGKKKVSDAEWRSLRNPISDIYSIDAETAQRAAAWKSPEEAWVFGYPMYGWADMSSPVTHIDAETNTMELRYVSMFGMKPHAPYYFYNVFEELDAPGEWYLDRENGILYLYPETDLEKASIRLSLSCEPVLRMEGTEYVTLRGMTFTGTRSDALKLTGNHLTVENCVIKNVAGDAIVISGSCNTVRRCEILHTGRGGVNVKGGDRASLTPSGVVIENNDIHHIAEIFRTYQPGVRMNGVGIVCRNNAIHDTPHMAIEFFGCNDCIMEYNEIYNTCLFADDSGAIYSGRDYTTQGNVIRCNFFHDMKSDADNHIGIFGVYCDDNLGSCTIEQNIFLRCQSAMLLHGGHNMTFTGNLIWEACPKSVYSVRYHRYGYWHDLLPGGTHDALLRALPWQGEVWSKAYPQIAEYLSWDPETEQCYPHNGNLSGNVIIAHKPFDVNFDWTDERFCDRVENNVFLDEAPETDLVLLCREVLPGMIDGFAPIPVENIGILC